MSLGIRKHEMALDDDFSVRHITTYKSDIPTHEAKRGVMLMLWKRIIFESYNELQLWELTDRGLHIE